MYLLASGKLMLLSVIIRLTISFLDEGARLRLGIAPPTGPFMIGPRAGSGMG